MVKDYVPNMSMGRQSFFKGRCSVSLPKILNQEFLQPPPPKKNLSLVVEISGEDFGSNIGLGSNNLKKNVFFLPKLLNQKVL